MKSSGEKVAIIGAGISGIVAAYLLQQRYKVTIYEKSSILGGHTHTHILQSGPDEGTPIDVGFMVLNNRAYPKFHRFLQRLGVQTRDADMNVSFSCEATNLHYGTAGLATVFADRHNLFRPTYYRFLNEILTFWKVAIKDLHSGFLRDITIGQYWKRRQLSSRLFHDFVAPFSAAIWSTSLSALKDFPAQILIRSFFHNGILSWRDQPQWQTISGGSASYIQAFERQFSGEMIQNSEILHIRRSAHDVTISEKSTGERRYDWVVVATHADEALKLLLDPSLIEKQVLEVWKYQKNRCVLHADTSFLPHNKKLWSAMNYRRTTEAETQPISVTYYMNLLQRLKLTNDYCVTLNPTRNIADPIYEVEYAHPLHTLETLQSQRRLTEIHGKTRTYYCGSYFGYGFHEDATKSAIEVGKAFGVDL